VIVIQGGVVDDQFRFASSDIEDSSVRVKHMTIVEYAQGIVNSHASHALSRCALP